MHESPRDCVRKELFTVSLQPKSWAAWGHVPRPGFSWELLAFLGWLHFSGSARRLSVTWHSSWNTADLWVLLMFWSTAPEGLFPLCQLAWMCKASNVMSWREDANRYVGREGIQSRGRGTQARRTLDVRGPSRHPRVVSAQQWGSFQLGMWWQLSHTLLVQTVHPPGFDRAWPIIFIRTG